MKLSRMNSTRNDKGTSHPEGTFMKSPLLKPPASHMKWLDAALLENGLCSSLLVAHYKFLRAEVDVPLCACSNLEVPSEGISRAYALPLSSL